MLSGTVLKQLWMYSKLIYENVIVFVASHSTIHKANNVMCAIKDIQISEYDEPSRLVCDRCMNDSPGLGPERVRSQASGKEQQATISARTNLVLFKMLLECINFEK